MAEFITLARPYAKAAFEFARGVKALAGWQTALAQAAAVSLHPHVQALLASPSYTSAEKGRRFSDICADALDDKQANFISVLAANNRLGLLPQISELFELYKANQEKTVDVEIQTAFAMAPEIEKKLAATLKSKLDREVELKTAVEKRLLGGALIRAGDTVIDGSARGRLTKLAEAMNV